MGDGDVPRGVIEAFHLPPEQLVPGLVWEWASCQGTAIHRPLLPKTMLPVGEL